MVKEFWRKAALQGEDFSQGTMKGDISQSAAAVLLSCQYWQLNDPFHCMPLLITAWSLSLHSVIEDWMIPLLITAWSLSLHSVIEDWMIPFSACHYWQCVCCIHHSRNSRGFSMGQTTSKIAHSRGGISTPSNTWMAPWTTRVSPKWHLDHFSQFCTAHSCGQQTERQTDHMWN